ncbi:pimeloyl-ACP methyl ester carboxylesterase [Natronospira proteinivora]|uniref:Pimeloyl-ACP methyl ester carboxylesterase n=1 Tax=Natronospira proteinivora TaxID=1807133 RepID=A0ABT1GC33_9GAMM|nr:alpha/beta fold hydrolase [Natronospira proteinivora]MCP1727838.1 pimeloyl-ACP methyl ester carboxylesterase [Natronospira proteinivora]
MGIRVGVSLAVPVLLLFMLALPGQVLAQAEGDWEWLRSEQVDALACPFKGDIDYEHGEVECGLIEVPENRTVPDSRSIELHFVRIRSTAEDEEEIRDDPVIYLTGGPGVQVPLYVRNLKDHSILERRDLYILEHRGIGQSGDFCPFFSSRNPELSAQDNFRDASRVMAERVTACFEKARARGVDLTAYNTIENARDVRALRMALGYEDWNVWGISYGSIMGQALLEQDPDGIRAMVLDAIVPLDLTDLMRIGGWYQRDLDKLFEACDEQDACARAYDGLASRYIDAIQALDESPVQVTVPESDIHPDGEAWLFQNTLVGMPFSLLYEQSNHPILPALLDRLSRAAEDRDKDFFTALAVADTSGGVQSSMGMGSAVRCLDGFMEEQARLLPEELSRNPVLTPAFGHPDAQREMAERCEELGLGRLDPSLYQQPQSDLPIVVANGAWDPITPPPLARYILDGLSNARYVEFPHAGHGPTRSVDCAGDFMNDFFDDPDAPLDEDCVESGESEAEYLARVYETDAVIRGLLMSETEPEALPGQAAWAGSSLVLAGGGFLTLGIGWLAGRVNRAPRPKGGGGRILIFASTVLILGWLLGMGLAAWRSSELSEALLLLGFLPWAGWFAWLAPLALIVAVAGLVQMFRTRLRFTLAGMIGLSAVALGVISLALFGLAWDLWPF